MKSGMYVHVNSLPLCSFFHFLVALLFKHSSTANRFFFFFVNLIVSLKVCVCVVQAAAEDGAGLFLHRIPAEPAADQRHGHTEGQDPLL